MPDPICRPSTTNAFEISPWLRCMNRVHDMPRRASVMSRRAFFSMSVLMRSVSASVAYRTQAESPANTTASKASTVPHATLPSQRMRRISHNPGLNGENAAMSFVPCLYLYMGHARRPLLRSVDERRGRRVNDKVQNPNPNPNPNPA